MESHLVLTFVIHSFSFTTSPELTLTHSFLLHLFASNRLAVKRQSGIDSVEKLLNIY